LTFPCFETGDFVIEIKRISDDSEVSNFKTRKSREMKLNSALGHINVTIDPGESR
jgi:hypothetical protein